MSKPRVFSIQISQNISGMNQRWLVYVKLLLNEHGLYLCDVRRAILSVRRAAADVSDLHRFPRSSASTGNNGRPSRSFSRKHHNIIQEQEANLLLHLHPSLISRSDSAPSYSKRRRVTCSGIAWRLLTSRPWTRSRELGGIAAIAISHPHYYTTMVEWSLAFDSAPIHLHSADRQWVMRPHANVQQWSGDSRKLLADLILIHTPGHFDGYQVLYWPGGSDRKGVLLSGDQPQVCMDTGWVSFMYSYPNYIPLGAQAIRQIVNRLDPYKFDRVYGAFPKRTVVANAKDIVKRSAERFMRAIVSEP